jgi:phosphoserine aminotransferase
VLFLHGGASLQFAAIPMNFLTKDTVGAYVLTGSWSEKALAEANTVGRTRVVCSTADGHYRSIPATSEVVAKAEDAYVHLTTNNTIFGTQWKVLPGDIGKPLVADASSDILSRPLHVDNFHLIYAGAQKNLGPSGLTVVVIRRDWLESANESLPVMLRYGTHVKHDSRYNTPPTFAVYLLKLVLEWTEQMGGVEEMERRSRAKSDAIYRVIDEFPHIYEGHAEKSARSTMNVTFRFSSEKWTKEFLDGASERHFVGLAGHRSVGGCRASLYNAVPLESAYRLADYMRLFAEAHSR